MKDFQFRSLNGIEKNHIHNFLMFLSLIILPIYHLQYNCLLANLKFHTAIFFIIII